MTTAGTVPCPIIVRRADVLELLDIWARVAAPAATGTGTEVATRR